MKRKNFVALASLCLATVAFGQVERVSLIETFTSSTCPPCNPGNAALESLLANGQNDGKYASLKYQMSWPGSGDPYYTAEGNVRRNFYSVNGVPATFVDAGAGFDGNPSNMTQNDLNTAYAIDPKMDIRAYYQIDEATQTVNIQIDLESYIDLAPGNRLMVAIFEYTTDNNVKSNGETEFYHVMKKMVPSSAGTVISPMSSGETAHWDLTYTFNGTYVLPPDATDPIDNAVEHSVEEFSDLGVVVWAQTMSGSKEVYQAANAIIGTSSLSEADAVLGTAKIYPNPATENAVVVFYTTQARDAEISVYDAFGKLVHTGSVETVPGRMEYTLNTAGFARGLYTVQINATGEKISKRLTVQ